MVKVQCLLKCYMNDHHTSYSSSNYSWEKFNFQFLTMTFLCDTEGLNIICHYKCTRRHIDVFLVINTKNILLVHYHFFFSIFMTIIIKLHKIKKIEYFNDFPFKITRYHIYDYIMISAFIPPDDVIWMAYYCSLC